MNIPLKPGNATWILDYRIRIVRDPVSTRLMVIVENVRKGFGENAWIWEIRPSFAAVRIHMPLLHCRQWNLVRMLDRNQQFRMISLET